MVLSQKCRKGTSHVLYFIITAKKTVVHSCSSPMCIPSVFFLVGSETARERPGPQSVYTVVLLQRNTMDKDYVDAPLSIAL